MTTSMPAAAVGAAPARNGQLPQAPTLPPVRRRRSKMLLLLGVVLVALCATGVVFVFEAGEQTVTAVGVAERVSYGQTITEAALRSVEVRADPGVHPVSWDQRSQLTGKVATADLLPGSVVTLDVVSGSTLPESGQQLVGVAVKAAQLPATPLQPRDQVLLVPSAQATGSASAERWPPVRGTVLRTGQPDTSGLRVVDVVVDAGDGPELATRASTGQVAIVLVARS